MKTSATRALKDRPIRWRVGTVPLGLGLLFSALLGVLAANRAEGQEPPRAFTPDPAESCEGKEPGASCWMEIADRQHCYTWNPNLAASETVTWSGECSGGLAQGTGSRQWSHPDDEGNPLVSGGEGELRDGRRHGRWSEYSSDGGMAEGSYEHGQPVGPWTNVLADGTVFEGEWANGQRQGKWTLTYGDDVGGGFYAAGKQHGRWRLLFAVSEAPYNDAPLRVRLVEEAVRGTAEGTFLAGNRDGLWVTRFDSGSVLERTYRNGVLHGPSTSRYADGHEDEGPYENGERHGSWTTRFASGREDSGRYKQGKRHGAWIERSESGATETYTYAEGSVEGPYFRRDSDGLVVEEGAFACRTSSCWSPYDDDLFKTGMWKERELDRTRSDRYRFYSGEGTYVDGERHRKWVLNYDDGERQELTYANGVTVGPASTYARDGTLISTGTYGEKGRKQGVWKERLPVWGEAIPYAEGNYVDGAKEGRWIENAPDGRFASHGPYKRGEKHGIWFEDRRFLNPEDRSQETGRTLSRGSYVNGRKDGVWHKVNLYEPTFRGGNDNILVREFSDGDDLRDRWLYFDGSSSDGGSFRRSFDGDAAYRVRVLSSVGLSESEIASLLGLRLKKVQRAIADPTARVRY